MASTDALRDEVSMDALMQQVCFDAQSGQEPPLMFISLNDGYIEGGQFPTGSFESIYSPLLLI